MTLRLTAEHLDQLRPDIRRQVEGHIVPADDARAVNCGPEKKHLVRKVNRPEQDIGIMLTTWIDLVTLPNGLKPGLWWYHIPNGLANTATIGGIFKAQGLRKGWPDYGLDIPAGPYHGFRLELKKDDGPKPTTEQLDHLYRLEQMGYNCGVAWGFDDAKRQTECYLDIYNRTATAVRANHAPPAPPIQVKGYP